MPTTDLQPIADDHTTGTTVHFLPERSLRVASSTTADGLARLTEPWPHLSVKIDDRRAT
ncbi:hypothetical protein [Streptomyces massasporeus]|uniref:hypothetical protein n=1 Tax=Streptomyces massasporeus TaxID=67324 RepID=UPI001E54F0E0|nr:hypothetical protein [Streptomyces massasporeus]